jgi:hypothetical protein
VDTTELDSFDSAVEGLLAPQPEAEEVEAGVVEEDEAEYEVEAELEEAEESDDPDEDREEPASDEYEGPEDDDVPAPPLHTVKIDGTEVKVSLEDLKRGYSGQQYVQKGMQEAAAMRKQAEQVYANLLNERQQISHLLQVAQSGLPPAPTPPDKSLRDVDPIGYTSAREDYEEAKQAYDGQIGQLQQVVQQQGQAQQYAQRVYLEREMETLKAVVPEFAEPDTAAQARDRLVTMGQEFYGYDPSEIGAVMDHRAIRVLHDAIKYQELMSGKQKAVTNAKPKAKRTVRAGAKKTRSNADAERQTRQKLKKSGSIDDALSLILK